MVVYLVVDIISSLVTNVLSDVVVIMFTSVDVVPSSISPPFSVTGGTLELIGLSYIFISLLLGRYTF